MQQKLEKILGFKLEETGNAVFGDYTANVAMVRAKEEGKKPRELAEDMVKRLSKDKELSELIEKIEIAGPGFINFWLKSDVLVNNLIQISKEKENYGKSDKLHRNKIVLEFTDPNPFKEFHIGHVYTNTIGESISRILEFVGGDVRRVNYQGDVGLHVAKSIWGMQEKMKTDGVDSEKLSSLDLKARVKFMGEAYAMGSSKYEDENIKTIINTLNKKIFEKDQSIKEIYKLGREWSLEYFETIYQRLGTKFNNYYFESEVGKTGLKIIKEYLKKGIFEESKGAVIFPGSKYGLHDRVFINSLGLPTYEAKELGLAPTKYKDFPYDQSIIITGNEINEYFKVLIKAMSLIYPELGAKTLHIGHGMVRLPEGKMSSRTGKIVTGEALLDQVKLLASKINRESSELVAVAAVKYAFLKVGIGQDIVYNINDSLSLEGNSGPYLQYTVARCKSVLAKANVKDGERYTDFDFNALNEDESIVARSLIRFAESVEKAAGNYAPNLLCNYLYDLAQKYNGFYNSNKIIDSEAEKIRLLITSSTAQVLENGLNLLGIKVPDKM